PIAPMCWRAGSSPCQARRPNSPSTPACARATSATRLNRLAGGPAARPRPLDIIAAQPAGGVDRLADHEQAGHLARFHRALGQLVGVDAAQGDLGLGVAFGAD